MPQVSFYPDSVTTTGDALELPDVLAGIKDGRWRADVEKARAALGNKVAYGVAKRKLLTWGSGGLCWPER